MNVNEWRSRPLLCNRSYHRVPQLWRVKKNNGGRKINFGHQHAISHKCHDKEAKLPRIHRVVQDVDDGKAASPSRHIISVFFRSGKSIDNTQYVESQIHMFPPRAISYLLFRAISPK